MRFGQVLVGLPWSTKEVQSSRTRPRWCENIPDSATGPSSVMTGRQAQSKTRFLSS